MYVAYYLFCNCINLTTHRLVPIPIRELLHFPNQKHRRFVAFSIVTVMPLNCTLVSIRTDSTFSILGVTKSNFFNFITCVENGQEINLFFFLPEL